MIPDWQLPPGTDRGSWEYISSERLAREYDEALAGTPLLQLDLRFAAEHFSKPGKLVDLGCGTGRLALAFAERGYDCLAIDLSRPMLDIVEQHARAKGLTLPTLQANLVELEPIGANEFDYGACLFSTLGMIRGRDNRRTFLKHVKRILKPGGIFVLHAHHLGYRFGRNLGKPGTEKGDRTMPQHRGGPDLTLHHFTRRELLDDLTQAGFQIREWRPVSEKPDGEVQGFFKSAKTYGFLVAAVA